MAPRADQGISADWEWEAPQLWQEADLTSWLCNAERGELLKLASRNRRPSLTNRTVSQFGPFFFFTNITSFLPLNIALVVSWRPCHINTIISEKVFQRYCWNPRNIFLCFCDGPLMATPWWFWTSWSSEKSATVVCWWMMQPPLLFHLTFNFNFLLHIYIFFVPINYFATTLYSLNFKLIHGPFQMFLRSMIKEHAAIMLS